MAGTLVKRVLLQITSDDGDTEEKLDAIKLKADELRDLHPELKVRIDTAEAQAKMAVLRAELKDLSLKADEEAAKGGILSRFLGGGRSGFFGLLSKIPWLGNAVPEGAAGEGGEGIAGMLGSGAGGVAAVGAIVDALAAASTEVTGLVSGFAAAGAGLGAFGVLAIPTIKQVTADLGDTQAQLAKLPWPIRQTVGEVKNLEGQFDSLAKQYAPEVSNLLSQAMGIVSTYAPNILNTLAKPVMPALVGVLAHLNSGLESKGFGNWLKQFSSLEGPSIGAIGTGIGHLADNIGKLLTTMSSKDVVNSINIAFSVIDGALVGFIGLVHYTMVVWDQLTSQWDEGTDQIRRGAHDIADGFDTARHGAASFGHGTADAFDIARHAAAAGGHDVAAGFDTARHGAATAGDAIEKQTDRTGSFVRTHWKEIAGWIVSPIGMAVFEIRTHTRQIAQEFDQLRHDTAAILAGMRHDTASEFDGIRHDIASDLDGARHDIARWTDDTVSFFAALPGRTVRALQHWADDLFHSGDNSVKSMGRGAAAGGTGVLSWFEGLPGRIVHALDRLAGDLFSAGQNALIGLVHGIEAGAAAIPSVMMGLAHEVESYFTDPLKIFSPSRVMYEHGLMVPAGAALGIEAGTPRIRQAAAGMARAVSGTALGAHGTATGTAAAGSHVTIQITGDAALRQWLKKSIRVTGGNVQVVGA